MTAMRKIFALAMLILAGCQPTYNWRDVGFEGTNVKAQLPCKPDRTTRDVTIAQTQVQLHVAGCEAGEAMWVVMTARMAQGIEPAQILRGWQAATWRTMQATDLQTQPWPATQALPGAVRVRAQGMHAGGKPTQAQGVWVAWPEGDGVQWVNAMVYHPRIQADLADTFFESLRHP
jgi:hypothetical protein